MSTADNKSSTSFSFWRVLLSGAVLGGICVGIFKWAESGIRERSEKESERSAAHWFRLTTPTLRTLDPKFTDANNDLVADPPAASARRSPDKLVFSFVAGPEAEQQIADFKDFVTQLSNVTGKPVDTEVYPSTEKQQEALERGMLHVTAFNTGAVPAAVASSGFVPFCTFGGDDDKLVGITMKIIVPAKSAIQKVEDLKGHTIAFTTPNSNSGCKAAVLLLEDKGMRPSRDYKWVFSTDHELSIKDLNIGAYDAAPVASDLLQRAISSGLIKPDDFRVIYESERFPPATFGYAYNLSDELMTKIQQAFLDFKPQRTSLAKRFEDSKATEFVKVSYKDDFALVRRVDSAFQPAAGE
jgi:phosphonate transport system substrate-binding protein